MGAAGPLQWILLVAIAGTGAMSGFIASAVILRNKRRARGYFLLGVLTGLMAVAITPGRDRTLSAFAALARRFIRPQRVAHRWTR
jgi:hypothetical protein